MRYILIALSLIIYFTACKKQDADSYQEAKSISVDSFDDNNRVVYSGSLHEIDALENTIGLDTTYQYSISVVSDNKDSSITFYDKLSVFTGIYKINSYGIYGHCIISGDSLKGEYSHGSLEFHSYTFNGKKTSK